MRRASSSTAATSLAGRLDLRRALLRLLLVGALVLGLIAGAGVARADDLTDARSRVRKAIVAAKKEITADQEAVESATVRLAKSQAALGKAQAELNLRQ